MPTANEAFRDALIRHQIGLVRMAPGITTKVNALLGSTEKDIVDKITARELKGLNNDKLKATLAAIRATRSEAWKKTGVVWQQEMADIAEAEGDFLDRTLNAVSPAVLNLTLPAPETLRNLVKSTPFEGDTMKGWAARQEAGDLARIEQSIRIGLTQGESSAQIAKRIVGTPQMHGTDGITQISRNNADSVTRTAVNAISNAAKQEFYGENQDVLDLEVFLATLDSRTTLQCASNDQKRFKHGVGPVPPLHWRCRSLRLATLNGEVIGNRPARNFTEKQLLREYAEANKLDPITKRDNLPKGHKGEYDKFARRRMRELTGPVPASLSYQEWLKGQSAAFQDDILGPARGKMFRDGGLSLDKFVGANGDRLSLNQMALRDHTELASRFPDARPPSMPGAAQVATLSQASAWEPLPKSKVSVVPTADKAMVSTVMDQLKQVGWDDFMKANPTAPDLHIRFVDSIPDNPRALGMVDTQTNEFWMVAQREVFKDPPGSLPWSMSTVGVTPEDVIRRSTTHEFGHVIHLGDQTSWKWGPVDRAVEKAFLDPAREIFTQYATTDRYEFFAESFAFYTHDAPTMLAKAPKAFKMVEDVLRIRGMKIKDRTKLVAATVAPVKPAVTAPKAKVKAAPAVAAKVPAPTPVTKAAPAPKPKPIPKAAPKPVAPKTTLTAELRKKINDYLFDQGESAIDFDSLSPAKKAELAVKYTLLLG